MKLREINKEGKLLDAYRQLTQLNNPKYLENEKKKAMGEIREFWTQRLSGEKSPKLFDDKNCWNSDFSCIKLGFPKVYRDDPEVYYPSEAALNLLVLLTENEFSIPCNLARYNLNYLSPEPIPGRGENEREMLLKILHPDALAKLSSSLDTLQLSEWFDIDSFGCPLRCYRDNQEKGRLIEKLAASLPNEKITELAKFAATCDPISLTNKLSQGGKVANKIATQIVEKLVKINEHLDMVLGVMLKRDGEK